MSEQAAPQPTGEQWLAAIEARANAATPGPWSTDSWEIYQGAEYVPGISDWIGETCRGATTMEQDRADAAFVAAARTDVPALVAEVRELLLHTRTLEALVAEQAAEIDRLRQDNRAAHASEQILQQQIDAQATEIDRLRAELKQTAGHRDYWHAELMCADARILELGRKVPKAGDR
jgi:predicted RNase H-like nuclease (RuvC/YqgF family)